MIFLKAATLGMKAVMFPRGEDLRTRQPSSMLILLDLNLPRNVNHDVSAEIITGRQLRGAPAVVFNTLAAETKVANRHHFRATWHFGMRMSSPMMEDAEIPDWQPAKVKCVVQTSVASETSTRFYVHRYGMRGARETHRRRRYAHRSSFGRRQPR